MSNIYSKLLEIQKAVRALAKDAASGSSASAYMYVSGSKVLDVVRPKMDELGLLLIPEVESIQTERIDYQVKSGAKSEMFTTVMMTFTWVDCETGEKLPVKFGANGQNGWDKGLGSALTYAERYFLLKFFHIATDEDDVDRKPNEDAAPMPNEDAAPVPEKKHIARGSLAWKKAVARAAKGEEGLMEKLRQTYIWDDEIDSEFAEDVLNYNLDNRDSDGKLNLKNE